MAYDKKAFLKGVTILCDTAEKENSHILMDCIRDFAITFCCPAPRILYVLHHCKDVGFRGTKNRRFK